MARSLIVRARLDGSALNVIAHSSGLGNVIGLQRRNGGKNHDKLEPFAGTYVPLFDAFHGIRPSSAFWESLANSRPNT